MSKISAEEDGAVAWAIELPDGSISRIGWMDMRTYPSAKIFSILSDGAKYVFAHRAAEREQAVAVTDEMVEMAIIAVFEQLAAVEQHGDFSSNWNGLSDLERNEIRATMRRVIEAVAPLLRGEVK